MNIRKKILFNPSHLKSTKPDTSDTTTDHTKNSALLQHSKTLRFSNPKTISTRRSRNYLRTLTKDSKQKDLLHNHLTANQKKNIIVPSYSTMSNENFLPVRKSVIGKKFLLEQSELPPLVSLKRTDLLTSQQQRKILNYPSSLHVISSKELFRRSSLKKQSNQGQAKTVKNEAEVILGQKVEQIQRRKQKLNSLNVASFYTTQKSITSSKYSMRSKQNNGSKASSDQKSSECSQLQKISRPMQLIQPDQPKQVMQSPEHQRQELQESIVQEIEKNESLLKSKLKSSKKEKNSSNQWSATLKSSFADSINANNKDNIKDAKSDNQDSSLCESESIDSHQVQERKNTHRNTMIETEKRTKRGEEKQTQTQHLQSSLKTVSSHSSLCVSYQVQTPKKV